MTKPSDRGYKRAKSNKSVGGKLAKHVENPDRQKNDFYPTPPEATVTLIEYMGAEGYWPDGMFWECASGQGHISLVLEARGYDVISTDLMAVERGFGEPMDFLKETYLHAPNIITNPPYSLLSEFIRHGVELDPTMLALHVPLQALLQTGRKKLLDEVGYPNFLYVFVPTLKVDSKLDGKPTSSVFNHVWAIWYPSHGRQHFSQMIMVDWREHVPKAQQQLGFA